MAVTVKKGDTITAVGVHSGTSSKGQYFLCKVKGEKAGDQITIWNNGGFECSEGDQIRIVDILEVKKYKRKYNEKWYDETDVIAELELIGNVPDVSTSSFEDITDINGDRLPF